MKAVVLLADGFEECEGLFVVDILRRAGVETVMASVTERLEVDSSRHIKEKKSVTFPDQAFDLVRAFTAKQEKRVGNKQGKLITVFNNGSKCIHPIAHISEAADEIDRVKRTGICVSKHNGLPE